MRTLTVLLWITTCEALGLISLFNDSDKNIILENALNAIDTKDFNFECSFNALDNYTTERYNEDIHLNITELILKNKYPVKEHHVTTEDGYILTVIRMPNDGPPVYLMHGLLCSADDFVTTNLPNSIAYNLWLEGYEVWIGNARGNKYSRKHITMNPDTDKEFWDFSWDEIGRLDLTTIIDYILAKTNKSQLIYIGHSQGTTAYFVMCSEKPEYNEKVALMISLSTVGYMSRLKSPVIRAMAQFSADLELFSQANVIYGHLPAGSSSKQLLHYLQEVKSGKFQKYDYGPIKNLKVYGKIEPPDYNVKKITSPVAIFYSDNDWLSNYIDVEVLMGQLPKVVDVYNVPLPKFTHVNFLNAKDLKTLVYSRLVELVKNYSPNPKR